MRKLGMSFSGDSAIQTCDQVNMVRNAGFDCVFTGYPSRERVRELAGEFARAGLVYESIHAPFKGINSIWLEGEEGDGMLARMADCLDACRELSVPVMVVHLSSGNDAPPVADLGRARWDKLIEAAVSSGVTVAFENQRKLANLAFVMELYRDISEVGFCWDCGHESCFVEGIEYMPISLFGKRLVYTHIHDNHGFDKGDLHYLPFDGSMDFERVARHIAASGYKGTLTLETTTHKNKKYCDIYTAEQFYAEAYARARKLSDMCDKFSAV